MNTIDFLKANEHKGGVGTETQIISANVYNKITQDKFIPIVFERNAEGSVCKPIYLQSRLHFDLTQGETYDKEFKRLVRKLYGFETYIKPELGVKPDWVSNPTSVQAVKRIVAFDELKTEKSDIIKSMRYTSMLETLSLDIQTYMKEDSVNITNDDDVIVSYDGMHELRNRYLFILSYSSYVSNGIELIGDFLEKIGNTTRNSSTMADCIRCVFVHEIFIYTIGWLYKKKLYHSVGYLLKRTYFWDNISNRDPGPVSYHSLFYSGSKHEYLDHAICKKTGQNFYSGTAQHWINTINVDYCSQEEFVLGDLICFNYSIYGSNYQNNWYWFPLTYIYDNEYRSCIGVIARKFISKEQASKYCLIFGFDTVDSFTEHYREVVNNEQKKEYYNYGYNSAFSRAAFLEMFIKPDEIGTMF